MHSKCNFSMYEWQKHKGVEKTGYKNIRLRVWESMHKWAEKTTGFEESDLGFKKEDVN